MAYLYRHRFHEKCQQHFSKFPVVPAVLAYMHNSLISDGTIHYARLHEPERLVRLCVQTLESIPCKAFKSHMLTLHSKQSHVNWHRRGTIGANQGFVLVLKFLRSDSGTISSRGPLIVFAKRGLKKQILYKNIFQNLVLGLVSLCVMKYKENTFKKCPSESVRKRYKLYFERTRVPPPPPVNLNEGFFISYITRDKAKKLNK